MAVNSTVEKVGEHWRVRLREGRRYIGSSTFSTETMAREWANVRAGEIERRGAGLMHASRVPDTIGDLLADYLRERVANMKSAPVAVYHIRTLTAGFGHLRYGELSREDAAAWIAARRAQVADETVRRELSQFSAFLTWCRRARGLPVLPEDPLDVDRPPPGQARDRRLRGDEAERLAHALCDHASEVEVEGEKRPGAYRVGTRNPWMLPLVLFAIETAARKGELLKLLWVDVDVQRRTALLRDTKDRKGRPRSREIPLSPRALALLAALPRTDDPRVFPTTDSAVQQAWQRACARAGIENLHFHDLRHEAISRLVERGVFGIMEVMNIAGHSTMEMVDRYTHLRAEDLAKKLE